MADGARRILFVGRDGTLIEAPADGRVDSLAKVRLMPGVIPALLRLQSAGYELVVVSNQAGLGAADFSREDFERIDGHVRALFDSQGIRFAAVLYCPHPPEARCACRKPGVGLVRELIAGNALDRDRSAVVGDGDADLEFAMNLGLPGHRVASGGAPEETWAHVAHLLLDRPRTAAVHRRTRETDVRVEIDLDIEADPEITTGLGFFDHMLEQLGKHGGFKLRVSCEGDLHIDEHHTVEDVALALGAALRQALGDKRGIQRYGFVLPMDETQARVALDVGGRPYLKFDGTFPRERVGELPTEMVAHFFRSLAEALGASLHIGVEGENAHHMVEACFKAVARTLRQAVARAGDVLPSTKGTL
jgi:imidazoleglycerol-phosphate dehydratase / histidinol-phosphatase